MKFKTILMLSFSFLLFSNILFADSHIEKYLKKIDIFEDFPDGRKIEIFEDVKVYLNPFQGRNKQYPIVNEKKIPEGYISKNEAEEYFKKFSNHAVIIDEEYDNDDEEEDDDNENSKKGLGDFYHFINQHFYITTVDSASNTNILREFPYEYTPTTPGTNTLYLCMDSDYKYVSKFKSFPPNALSCRSCPSLCGKRCSKGHKYGQKNIYSNFKANLLENAEILDAEEIFNKNIYVEAICKDRTPPAIISDSLLKRVKSTETYDYTRDKDHDGVIDQNFCTTGDWFYTDPILVKDNYTEDISARITYGKVFETPMQYATWQDKENWNNHTEVVKVEKNEKKDLETNKKYFEYSFRDLIDIPAHYFGEMRYSIYLKEGDPEGDGLVNGSLFSLKENHPEIGYGLPSNPDLGNTPTTAQDWNDRRNIKDLEGYEEGIQTRSLGIIDNDQPNILIRVTDTETGDQMFFPPCVGSGAAKISKSSLFTSRKGYTDEDEYNLFVKHLKREFNYDDIILTPKYKPCFTVFTIDDKSLKTEEEWSYVRRTILNNDIKFINENVRLEDYYYSDTNKDSSRITDNKVGCVGKRNGTFQKMVALFESGKHFRFKTDVKYRLDVWTDDNVKWVNYGHKDSAEVFHTGISTGSIVLDVPQINNYD